MPSTAFWMGKGPKVRGIGQKNRAKLHILLDFQCFQHHSSCLNRGERLAETLFGCLLLEALFTRPNDELRLNGSSILYQSLYSILSLLRAFV